MNDDDQCNCGHRRNQHDGWCTVVVPSDDHEAEIGGCCPCIAFDRDECGPAPAGTVKP